MLVRPKIDSLNLFNITFDAGWKYGTRVDSWYHDFSVKPTIGAKIRTPAIIRVARATPKRLPNNLSIPFNPDTEKSLFINLLTKDKTIKVDIKIEIYEKI